MPKTFLELEARVESWQLHLPLSWPKQEVSRQCRRAKLHLQGLKVVNESTGAGLSTADPKKQRAEWIFPKEFRYVGCLQGGGSLLAAASRLRGRSCLCRLDLSHVLDSSLVPQQERQMSSFHSCPEL